MSSRLADWVGRALRKAGTEIMRRNGIEGTWIDVGAHLGESTIWHAQHNPGLKIYAIEPNLQLAAKMMGRASNYVVLPMAISEEDGYAEFHINAFDGSSSLLPMSEEGLRSWIGGEMLKVDATVTVPTVRLDTLMNLLGIEKVDFLKIDAQGMDLAVVKSAGARLGHIDKIVLEVDVASQPLYLGAPSKDEVLHFLDKAGFELIGVQKQSHDLEENLTFRRRPTR